MRRPTETMSVPDSAFAHLLLAFAAESRTAARAFDQRRAKLIYVLHGLGCANADDLADEVLARVEKKLAAGVVIGNLNAYLLAVARLVALEHGKQIRSKPLPLESVPLAILPSEDPQQIAHEREALTRERRSTRCLKRCWRNLPEAQRKILGDYFSGEGRARSANRKRLAQELGVALATLRVEIHRLRAALEDCARACRARRKIGL